MAGSKLCLQDCGVTRKEAEAVVMAAARKVGAGKDAGLKTKLEDLSGLKDGDGDFDTALRLDLATSVGQFAGLVATEDSAAAFKTLGDLVDWVAAANDAPIMLVAWSPNCPSVKRQNDRAIEVAAKSKVRLFAIACNTRDTDEHYATYKENYDWNVRIFPDREQRVVDLLGAKATPHYFLIDKDGVLRYKGAIDDDGMGYMEEDERENYVMDAVKAIRAGKEIGTKETAPSG